MVALKLEDFSGLQPRRSARLLPPNAATVAENTKLLEGELRGYHVPTLLADFSSVGYTVGRAYRIPASVTGLVDAWLTFQSPNTDVVRSPVLNDQFNRYYWASDAGVPQYNTLARIVDGNVGANAPFDLGVPQPAAGGGTGFTVTPSSAGSNEVRSYVYTLVTAYNEEGPPCNPVTVAGDVSSATWSLAGMSTTYADQANRNVTTINIYRTVPNATNPAFFFVDSIPFGTSTYSDVTPDTTVALNRTLDFVDNFPPIPGLSGFALMPQGYLVGFSGRNLCFTEPFLPHAWNPTYQLGTEFEIVGLVMWNQTMIICTTSVPYMGSGATPGAFTMQKLDGVTPCLSRRGIVATVAGAYFPTVDGLAQLNTNGLVTVTQDLFTQEEWATYDPTSLLSAQLGLQYISFNSPSTGFVINPTEGKARLSKITAFNDVTAVETDRYTGLVTLVKNNQAFEWDPPAAARLYWHWQSKVFQVPKFVNFGAFKIKFDLGKVDITTNINAVYGPYNKSRLAKAMLNPICSKPLGSSGCAYRKGLVGGWTLPENRSPLGGSPLYPLNYLALQNLGVRFIVYCNGLVVSDQVCYDDKIKRIPSGFKHDLWQFEMFGNTDVYSVQIAETGKELSAV